MIKIARYCVSCNCLLDDYNSYNKDNKCKSCIKEMRNKNIKFGKEKMINEIKQKFSRVEAIKDYEWKFVITDCGKIFRLNNNNYKEIKGGKTKSGYLIISLEKTKDGSIDDRRYIHRLVAENFVPNPNNYKYVNHKDGNKMNNHASNLEWCTASYNNQHAYDFNLKGKGEHHYASKLTEENVLEIRKLKGKMSQYKIAEMYGVTRSCILQILNNKTWKWL